MGVVNLGNVSTPISARDSRLIDRSRLVESSSTNPHVLRNPPDQPLSDLSGDAEWYGETWVKYPANQTLSP